jgi:hypothetical protein
VLERTTRTRLPSIAEETSVYGCFVLSSAHVSMKPGALSAGTMLTCPSKMPAVGEERGQELGE